MCTLQLLCVTRSDGSSKVAKPDAALTAPWLSWQGWQLENNFSVQGRRWWLQLRSVLWWWPIDESSTIFRARVLEYGPWGQIICHLEKQRAKKGRDACAKLCEANMQWQGRGGGEARQHPTYAASWTLMPLDLESSRLVI